MEEPYEGQKTREYDIEVPVVEASGCQTYRVTAESEEEALRIVAEGGGEYTGEDLQVVTLDRRKARVV